MNLGERGWSATAGIVCFLGLLAAVAVFCLAFICCWTFRCAERVLRKRKSDSKNGAKLEKGIGKVQEPAMVGEHYWMAQTDHVIYQTGEDGFADKMLRRGDAASHKSNETDINLRCIPFAVNRAIRENEKFAAAKLKIRLSYRMLKGDSAMGRLTVYLMEVSSLPHREYYASLEPYVVLDVINNKWPVQKSDRIVQTVQSRVVRHTFDPKFDQVFLFDVKKSEMKDWCLKFTVFDKDRLTRCIPICEKRIFMKDVKNLTSEPGALLVAELQEVCGNNGQILFGITYLPTAQRLNISIVRASELKYLGVARALDEFCPFVRVLMLNGMGKCVRKKKTGFRHAEESPIFNETLAFDLPVSNLEHVAFLLVLCSKASAKRSGTEADLAPKESKDAVLGAVVVGRNVKNPKARDHWLMVMQNPRKVISVWHHLRSFRSPCWTSIASTSIGPESRSNPTVRRHIHRCDAQRYASKANNAEIKI